MPDSIGFTLTLPKQVIENMMKLAECGHYGNNRGEIARQLVFLAMRDEDVQRQIEKFEAQEPKKVST